MKTFLAALILLGFGILGMCFNIIFRKNGQFPQSDIGANENMRRMGIKCMRQEEEERWGDGDLTKKSSGRSAGCTGEYSESCQSCGLLPYEYPDKVKPKK